jgi:Thioesterase-like superfamily
MRAKREVRKCECGGAAVDEAFYQELEPGRFRATGHAVGPWSQDAQHMGPPAALITRELERCGTTAGSSLVRLVFEVLGPVPLGELTVKAAVERHGRTVELLSAELSAGGRTAVRAHAWRAAHADTSAVAGGGPAPLAPPTGTEPMMIPYGLRRGYLEATEWRALSGGMTGTGAATVWGRTLVDVVAGEQASPLQRLCAIADSGNGVSGRLDIGQWLFINTDLTLHLYREPAGEWIGLDVETTVGPAGSGLAAGAVHDETGPVGRSAQSLVIRPR